VPRPPSRHSAVTGTPIREVERKMGNSWIVNLRHFLEPSGALAPLSGRGLRLAEYWTQIVAQASNYEEPTTAIYVNAGTMAPWRARCRPLACKAPLPPTPSLNHAICRSRDEGL
jgi:hypothetical protein